MDENELEEMRRLAKLGYELSLYAASIEWTPRDDENDDDHGNSREWLLELKEKIEAVQDGMEPHLKRLAISPGFNMVSPMIRGEPTTNTVDGNAQVVGAKVTEVSQNEPEE